jgi:hypothetical protein
MTASSLANTLKGDPDLPASGIDRGNYRQLIKLVKDVRLQYFQIKSNRRLKRKT